jgi:nitroreductase
MERERMELPVARWHAAIFNRRSRRTFSARIPEKEKTVRLETVCREFRPLSEARAELILNSPEHVFRGVVGRYGRVNGAPFYVAFIGRMSSPHVQEDVGYLGEGIILEATALGLDTCWVGGFFRPDVVREHIALAENEQVLSVTPIGYAIETKDLSEKLLSGLVRSRTRMPLRELIQEGEPAPWMEKALEAARRAPSARNRQPWRFKIKEKEIIISEDIGLTASRISRRLDCGIAMLHLELGARAAGVSGRWELLPTPEVARFIGEL